MIYIHLVVVDSSSELIDNLKRMAENDPVLKKNVADGRLSFVTADLSNVDYTIVEISHKESA